MKKALATLLCLLLLGTTALVSCNNNSDNTSSTAGDNSTVVSTSSDTASDSTDTSVDENGWVDGIVGYLGDGKWGRKMPEFKWTDKNTFTVLVYNNEKEATYYSEEIEPNLYETTYDAINDAVDRRNKLIEEKYGITIKARAVADVYSTLSTELQVASDDNCDAAMPFLPACTTLAQDGYLYDLNEFAADGYLDLSMPWWDQNANESFSIADKTYFSISDMSIMQKIVSCCLMFNKDLLKSKYPSLNLYDEVNNKTWTIDKMLQLSKDFTYDSDGVDGLSGNDTWGPIAAYNDSLMLYLSSGSRLVTKNSNDEPVLSLGVDERSINIAQNVLSQCLKKRAPGFSMLSTSGTAQTTCGTKSSRFSVKAEHFSEAPHSPQSRKYAHMMSTSGLSPIRFLTKLRMNTTHPAPQDTHTASSFLTPHLIPITQLSCST